jgi:Phospholipase A2-like domain
MSTKIGGLLNHVINKLPVELHIPGYQFCGPGTHLEKRLARGDQGINQLDAACREHDIAYSRSNDLTERHAADKVLAKKAQTRIIARDSSLGERAAATAVWAAMKAKTKLGMGLKTKMKTRTVKKKKTVKKRILPVAKRGGVLPILPMLGALGSLIGGAAGVAKAVNDRKAAQRQLQEMLRHNRALEGHGLYLAPYKYGRGVLTRKKGKKTSKRR